MTDCGSGVVYCPLHWVQACCQFKTMETEMSTHPGFVWSVFADILTSRNFTFTFLKRKMFLSFVYGRIV